MRLRRESYWVACNWTNGFEALPGYAVHESRDCGGTAPLKRGGSMKTLREIRRKEARKLLGDKRKRWWLCRRCGGMR